MFSLCNWKFQGCQLQCRFCGEYEIFLHNSCSMRDRNKILLSLLRNEDLNWPFKLLKIITLIISLDMRDLPLQLDIIQRKLRKTIWNSHFPMTQTVCRQKCSLNFLSGIFKIKFAFFSEIILSYTLATGSSATDFSLDDSVSIRFVKILEIQHKLSY